MARIGVPSSLLAVTICAVLSVSCSSSEDPCSGNVQVTAASGTTPVFDWSPRCGVWGVTVLAPGNVLEWSIFMTDLQKTMLPPIQYGSTPPGAFARSGANQLSPGTMYTITITATGGRQVGTLNFTP
jgi:hypothetical protein